MIEKTGECFLCGQQASVGAPGAPSGGIMASTLVSCGKCRTNYLVPKTTDLEKLKALSPEQKAWIAGEARRLFETDPSNPFVVNVELPRFGGQFTAWPVCRALVGCGAEPRPPSAYVSLRSGLLLSPFVVDR